MSRPLLSLRSRYCVALVSIATMIPGSSLLAQSNSDIESLREEMMRIQSEYESRIKALEAKIEQLEQKSTVTEAKVSEVTESVVATRAEWEQQKDSWQLPSSMPSGFSFNGYLRAGYGVNGKGGGIEEFVIPDGIFETGYRLGNEKDTYGELIFSQVFNQDDPDSIHWKLQALLAFKFNGDKTNYTDNDARNTDLLIREAFVEASNLFKNNPEVSFWAGQRFYDRHDIHITDFYFLDMSGWGAGVDNIPVGPGKLAVAYLGGTLDRYVDTDGTMTKQNLDIRYKQLPVLGGELMLWFNIAYQSGGDFTDVTTSPPVVNSVDSDVGIALGAVWFKPLESINGFYKTSLMWGEGAASDFNTYIADYKSLSFGNSDAIKNSETIRWTNQIVGEVNEQLSYMATFYIDWNDQGGAGASGESTRTLYSAGIRPIYQFNDWFALQGEVGVDYVDTVRFSVTGDGGALYKFTIAPTIREAGGFWARPEIRLFATYAFWDDELEGFGIGGNAYSNSSSGLLFGVQAETWW